MTNLTATAIKELEQALINSESEEQAKSLLEQYTLPELKVIQQHLQAYKRSATKKQGIIQAIVDCTYSAVRTSKIIRNLQTK